LSAACGVSKQFHLIVLFSSSSSTLQQHLSTAEVASYLNSTGLHVANAKAKPKHGEYHANSSEA
jgi:hypothetical protein